MSTKNLDDALDEMSEEFSESEWGIDLEDTYYSGESEILEENVVVSHAVIDGDVENAVREFYETLSANGYTGSLGDFCSYLDSYVNKVYKKMYR